MEKAAQNQKILQLRNQTKVLIRNLWEAAQDKETFESVLGPVKDRVPTPPTESVSKENQNIYGISKENQNIYSSSSSSQNMYIGTFPFTTRRSDSAKLKNTSFEKSKDYVTVGRISRPKKSNTTSSGGRPIDTLLPRKFDGDILMERDDDYFKQLHEFRKLYPESFMKSSFDTVLTSKRRLTTPEGGGYQQEALQSSLARPDRSVIVSQDTRVPLPPLLETLDTFETGFFRVDPMLTITKHEHPFKSIDGVFSLEDDEEEGYNGLDQVYGLDNPCKVSIPIDTCPILPKMYFL